MANDRDLSQLMMDAYNSFGKRQGSSGFIPYGNGRDLDSGLRIQAYINEATKEVVIGVSGTNDQYDLSPDLEFLTGGYQEQFSEAEEFARDVQLDLSLDAGGFQFFTTGRSLGGWVAQVLSYTGFIRGSAAARDFLNLVHD